MFYHDVIMILDGNHKLYTTIKRVGPLHRPRKGGKDCSKEEDKKDRGKGGHGEEDRAAEYC